MSTLRATCLSALVLFIIPPALAADTRTEEEPQPLPPEQVVLKLTITDNANNPVSDAQAFLLGADGFPITERWADAQGHSATITVGHLPEDDQTELPHGAMQLVVRAPQYAPSITNLELPLKDHAPTITLNTGNQYEFTITPPPDHTLPPDLIPLVYHAPQAMGAWALADENEHAKRFAITKPRRLADGRYQLNLNREFDDLYLMVNHPGFLRAFQAGPLANADLADNYNLQLPKPAAIHATFKPHEDVANQKMPHDACTISIYAQTQVGDDGGFFWIAGKDAPQTAITYKTEDLAPGNYLIVGKTGNDEHPVEYGDDAYYNETQRLSLEPDATQEITFAYKPYDKQRLLQQAQGEYAASVTVKTLEGKPAANMDYELGWWENLYGRQIVARSGKTTDQGTINLHDLAGGEDAKYMSLQVDGTEVGNIYLADDQQKNHNFEFTIPPRKGDTAPDLLLQNAFTEKPVRLSDYKGQVLFLDFWATWCGPCQQPMAHNSDIIKRRAKDWKGKAAILGISIDRKRELVVEHCKARGWDNVTQLWAAEGTPGFNSNAGETYGIRGVPTALLIGPDGKILWRGHPAAFQVEDEIDKLLKEHDS